MSHGIEDARYDLYPLERIELVKELLSGDIRGLNVTIPYKQQVISYLDGLSDEAHALGAVNTIKIDRDGCKGYNTDVYGFEQSLLTFLEDDIDHALVLGMGGSARAVCYVLEQMGIAISTVSRGAGGDYTYHTLTTEIIAEHRLIINTTPLGMSPNLQTYPAIPYEVISGEHYLFDLVYNPVKTLFLRFGESRGAKIKNGLEMLECQADRAWEIWNTGL